jgi:hypothetical protein
MKTREMVMPETNAPDYGRPPAACDGPKKIGPRGERPMPPIRVVKGWWTFKEDKVPVETLEKAGSADRK